MEKERIKEWIEEFRDKPEFYLENLFEKALTKKQEDVEKFIVYSIYKQLKNPLTPQIENSIINLMGNITIEVT